VNIQLKAGSPSLAISIFTATGSSISSAAMSLDASGYNST